MNAKQKLHQARLTEWTARFSDQQASGLTVRQWCEQNSISIHKYNYWKHQLKEEVVDQMLPEIVQLSVTTPVSSSDSALTENPSNTSSLTDHSNRAIRANRTNRTNYTDTNIRLCVDGMVLELEPSISEDFLRTLIRAVHYA